MKQKKTELKSRFIPVYTGNTRITTLLWSLTAVHPRIHGEHGSSLSEMPLMAGSSPYTRGTLIHLTSFLFSARFIPVYTGNTPFSAYFTAPSPVHPRIHGEHITLFLRARLSSGSSPYTRGTLMKQKKTELKSRFIPVYTGNTF